MFALQIIAGVCAVLALLGQAGNLFLNLKIRADLLALELRINQTMEEKYLPRNEWLTWLAQRTHGKVGSTA